MAGGGFTVNSQGIVSGSGVTIYNTSSSGWGCSGSSSYTPIVISGQTKVTLSAPNSGPLAGIVIFGNRTGCSSPGSCQDQVNGGSTSNFNGAVYVKSDNLLFSGANPSGSCMVAVADKITINGNSTFGDTGCAINPVSVSVSPQTTSLYAGQSQQFSATVTNSNNSVVTWSISPAGLGTISSSGLYVAPASVTTQQTVTITATSQADTSKSASATVTLLVHQTTPTITWVNPAAISYGTSLSAVQLNAAANVQGTFAYSPAAGTILAAGTQTLSVTFTPTDTVDYTTATAAVHLTVNKATPAISWPAPAAITYGTALTATQQDASSTVAGNFVYSPASGTVPPAGTQTLSTTFTPTDTDDYSTATATVSLTVSKAAPSITWATPSAITYGAALTLTQLDATSTVPGTFAYSPAAGVVPAAGVQILSTTLTPADSVDYATATAAVSLTINKATPIITWPTPGAVTYGTALSATQLNASASIPGMFSYAPALGTVLLAGTQTLTVTFTPTDTVDYNAATTTVSIVVNQATPAIMWAAPAAVTFGTALSATQLNASSNIPGTFAYTPTAGTVLQAGVQTLSVTFTPTDSADYTTSTASVTLTVNASVSISLSPTTVTLTGGQSQQFTASEDNTSNNAVTWTINPSGVGTFDQTGLYTAPTTITTQQTLTVTATSQADTSRSATATITLTPTSQCVASGYSSARAIVIDHTKVPNTDQANFPFLFNTTDATFATTAFGGNMANANGYDIVFSTDPGAATRLDYEIEKYNPATGQLIAWIRIPTLSHTTDTTIYMFYGNSSVSSSQQNPSGVWDSHYKGVWHVPNGTVLSMVDSTSNGNNAMNNGAVATAGEIDGGMLTDGSSTYATIGTPASLSNLALGNATFSAWVNPSAGSGVIMGKDDDNYEEGWSLGLDSKNNVDFAVIHANANLSLIGTSPLPANTWSLVTVTMAGTAATSQATIYINGVANASSSGGQGDTVDDSSQTAYLANANYGDSAYHPFNGSLDEFRISNTIRSTDWIATEYNDESSPATFYSVQNAFFAISPNPVTLYASQTQQFSAVAVNSCSSSATWSISPSNLGTISANGLYTAPQSIATQQTVTVTAASIANPSKSSSATITLSPPIAVNMSPTAVTLSNGGQQQQFTATVTNTSNTAVTWTINPAGVGTIDATGLYTAPNGITGPQTVTVTATSQADSTLSVTATITLNPPVLPPPVCASNGYSFTRAIVIDHTQVPNGDQSNFPFLLNSTDPTFATTANGGHVANINGYDIIFSSDPAGQNVLSYEMEKYNPATGQVIAWVSVPNLSHTADTVIYMFYGNNSINTAQQNPAGVWDSSYLGVWHVPNGTRLSLADSSTYHNNATNSGAIAAPGEIDGGMQTDGATYATIGASASLANLPSGNATFSAWVKVDATGSGIIMGKENSTGENVGWELDVEPNHQIYFESLYDQGRLGFSSNGNLIPGQWAYVTVTLAGTPDNGGQATIYINGVASGAATGSGQPGDDSAQNAYLANVSWDWPFEGSTDEFRISNVVRSADWIATEYNNQATPFLFYQLSGENAVVIPSSAALYGGQSKQFIASTGCGSLPSVSWSMPSSSPGTLTAAGLYTAPPTIDAQQAVNVAAISTVDGSTVGSALITLFPPIQVSVSPATVTLYGSGETTQFTASVLNATNAAVVWSLSPAGIGSIDNSGLFTTPASLSGAQTVTVTATSVIDPAQSASATVSISPLVISPTIYSIYGGFSQQFTANMPVIWSASEGTIDATGLYTAPTQRTGSSVATIVATSLADPNAAVSLTVSVSPSLQLSPTTATLYGGQTLQFSNCGALSQNSWQCPLPSVWTIVPTGAGTIDSNGFYTAPLAIPTQQTITVIATAASNPLQQGSATITLTPPTVSITPQSGTLYSGQSEQFAATIRNATSTDVIWSISPAGLGTISASGLYQAPNGIVTQQVVTVTASSKAVPSISASASITLSPAQCLSKSYNHVRSITIDHNKVPNTDQSNFPFLFTATDSALAAMSNGGHVANPSGYDIVFSSDPAGVNRLDYEIEQYNPATGQIAAWIRVPKLSHNSDTVIYMFYGNSAITASQQNPVGAWQNKFGAIYHLAGAPSTSTADSTGNQNNGSANGLLSTPGVFDVAAAFNGSTSYIALPGADFGDYPANGIYTSDYSTSLATWFKTSQEGVILGQTLAGVSPGEYPYNWIPALYIDNSGLLRASLFNLVNAQQDVFFGSTTIDYNRAPQIVSTAPYNDNQWHFAALTYGDGTETLYVDGQPVGAQYAALQSGYSSNYSYFVGTGYTWQWAGTNASWDYLKGSLEEIEVSDAARSGDWIRTEYLNQSSPATFASLSPELNGNVSISPLAPVLYGGQSQQFTILDAALCGSGGGSWTMPAGSLGTLSVSGLYTAPPTVQTQQTVVISATTLGSNSAPVTATVTLMPAIRIAVSPLNAALAAGDAQQFTASVANSSNTAVAWSISPTTAGSITPNGLYLAPQKVLQSQTVTVTATSLADANQSASATITLAQTVAAPAVSVALSPASVVLDSGQSQQFAATVNNSSNTSVTWSMQPSGIGTLSSSGLYTAPAAIAAQQSITITATSQADPTKSASAIVTLTATACASTGFGYQRAVVIDHTKIPNSDLSNFPLLFNTTDPAFASVANGGHVASPSGYDIIFSTDPNGQTRLDEELESYNSSTGQVIAWVRIPKLSHSADTVLYIFYGNPNVTSPQQNPSGVWDQSYQGVWHMPNGTTLSANDSTANNNNGVITTATAVPGEIDGGASFDGSTSVIATSYVQTAVTAYTVEAWISTSSPNVATVVDDRGSNGHSLTFGLDGNGACGSTIGCALRTDPNPTGKLMFGDDAGGIFIGAEGTTLLNDGSWHHVVGTWSAPAGTSVDPSQFSLYVDGKQVGNPSSVFVYLGDTSPLTGSGGTLIGAGFGNYAGLLDEVRISTTVRSADWVATEYNNQSSPGSFYALQAETTQSVTPNAVTLFPAQSQQFTFVGSCNAGITWSMPNGSPGWLTSTGLYTAPAAVASQQSVTITATSQADSSLSASATVTLMPQVSVSITPSSVTLSESQSEQFSALVTNSPNPQVTWSVSPAGMGTVDPFGAYIAPSGISSPQQATVTAESLADPTKFASAAVTITPTVCASAAYGYQRVIVIDHTKVGNADLSGFPLLFNTTDQDLASVDNGGHVASPSGFDILFSSDPNGMTKLDYELEKYDPATGQVVAWIRIPTLSHTTDTVLYVFYGNSNITSTQQNPAGVWTSNYLGVYHFANEGLQDSTRNANNATPTSISTVNTTMASGVGFSGSSSYFQVPSADFPNFPTGVYDNIANPDYTPPVSFSSSFGLWFKTPVPGGLLGQVPSISTYCIFYIICGTYPTVPGTYDPASWGAMLYVDDNGKVVGGGAMSANSYDDNNWHYVVVTYALDGTDTLYVDGQAVGSATNQFPTGYSPSYSYFVGTSYTFLGDDGNFDWLYLNGSVDEVKVTNAPLSAAWIQTEFNNQGSPSTFYKFYQRTTTQIAPASVSLYALQAQQFAVPGLCDSAVNWSLASGAPGSLSSTGLYTAPATIASQQSLAVSASSRANGDNLGTATVTLLPPPLPITLTANEQPPYQVGSTQSFSATVMDEDGTPSTGVTVAFAVTGSNAAFANATTDDNGVATYTYLGANSGTDNIQATISLNGQLLVSNSINAAWLNPITTTPAAAVALLTPPSLGVGGLIGAFTDNAGNVIQPIAIGATARTLPVPAGATQLQLGINSQYYPNDGGAGFTVLVNGVSVSVPPTAMPWVWTVGGQNARFQYGIYNPSIQNGVLDGTPPVIAAQNLTAGSTVTVAYQSGTASINLPVRPLVDADGDQTWTPAAQIWQGAAFATQYTTTKAYTVGQPITFDAQVLDVTGAPMANVRVTLNISGANPQTLQATTDASGEAAFLYTGANAGADSLVAQAFPAGNGVLTSELGSVTWVSRPTPPTPPGALSFAFFGAVNIGQVYNISSTDSTNQPVKNANLGYYVWGVDNFSQAGTTDVTGHGSFGYNHYNAGPFNIVAIETLNGNTIFSNVITGTWTTPTSTTGCVNCSDTVTASISGPSSVNLPNSITLTGTVTDSQGINPIVSWTQISGPGTATFSAADQAVTNVSFSDPGVYVVQLYATDDAASASVQFTINVRQAQATGVSQGWIGSPLYGASVSGIVPITLAPGVSLQSGTLTYFPTTDTSNVTVLNANVTGSGQIGVLDTTQLLNGSYWIQLHGVDASGDSQYSLIMVTATGDYKPGRVTATVTDLVVPSTGLAINIQRTYDSLNAATSSDFGYGWSLGINVNLMVSPAGDVTFTLGGQRKTFYLAPQMPPCSPLIGCLFPYYFVAYRPEPGMFGTLTTAGQACPLDIVVPNGNLWECQGGGAFNPSGYVYTDPRGTAYTISASGSLQSIGDRNGNGLTITPNGITSTTGLSVPFVRDSSGRITQITDTQGNIYQYTYDANGNLASVQYPNVLQPSTYTYDPHHLYLTGTDFRSNPLPSSAYYESSDTDANGNALAGRLKSVTNGLGQTTSYAYDINAHSTTITYPPDAIGVVGESTMVYNAFGDLLTSTDPLGHTTTNVYDAKRNLTSVTDPLGHTTSYTYDPNGNRSSVTYPANATSTNTTRTALYNQYSEPISTTDELGNVRTFNYDANYNPQNITDSAGTLASFSFNSDGTMQSGAIGYDLNANPRSASQFTYDANGNMTGSTDALGRSTSYTYNYLGQKTSMTVPLLPGTSAEQARTVYSYDALGNLIEADAPLGRTTKSCYDANGNKVSDTDARGNTTTYTYDALNRLTQIKYPDSTTTKKNYDFRGNVIDEWDQAANQTHHVYDLAGRQVSVTQAYGTSSATTTTYAYDNDGRKLSETDNLGHATTYAYDAAGNLTGVSGVNGTFRYGYDNARNRVSTTDGNNHTTSYSYDARKRLTTTTYPDQSSVANAYDGPGNLIKVTDQNNHVVEYAYDATNQLLQVIQRSSPNSANTTLMDYDPDGNLASLEDANSHTTSSSFDLLGELRSKTLPDASSVETREYDAAGNLKTLTHFNGVTTTYSYDNLNRLLSRATTGEPTVSFTYTATGRRQTMTDASGTTTYTYDNMDRLLTKATPEGTLLYAYDGAGHLASTSSSNPNGVNVSYTYDTLNRLNTVVDSRLGTTTYNYDDANNVANVTYPNGVQTAYTYDDLNRVKAAATQTVGFSYIRDAAGKITNALELDSRSITWNYDGANRLQNESIANDPNGKNGQVDYSLDPVGNRSSATSSISGLTPIGGSFNQDDELTSAETYDQDGNVISTGGKSFAYNSQNQLVSMGNTVGLAYDGDGNRVAKVANGTTTRYLVDDLNPTGYPQVVDELTNGVVTRTYTYGLQRISQAQVVSGSWTTSFYVYDGGGSVRALTNSLGAVTDAYDYDAFGNLLNKTGSTPNSYLYRGEFFDSDLGLYYLKARWINPLTGRFMSRDPLDGTAFIPRTLHKYLYAGGDPVNYVDPSGEDGELVGYIDLAARSFTLAERVAAYGCYASIALTSTSLFLAKKLSYWDLAGAAATAYGCVTLSLPSTAESNAGKVLLGIKKLADYGTCALSLATMVHDLQEYIDAKSPDEQTFRPFFLDTFGTVVGCVTTQLATEFDVEAEE